MTEPIYTTYQIGYKKWASIDYFHDSTDHKYTDQNKYKVVSTKWREITDEEDQNLGLRDWEWKIQVYKIGGKK